jgi:hypothetical protein
VSANTTSISEAEPQFYCPTTSGYGQETGKFSPTKTGKLSPTVTKVVPREKFLGFLRFRNLGKAIDLLSHISETHD